MPSLHGQNFVVFIHANLRRLGIYYEQHRSRCPTLKTKDRQFHNFVVTGGLESRQLTVSNWRPFVFSVRLAWHVFRNFGGGIRVMIPLGVCRRIPGETETKWDNLSAYMILASCHLNALSYYVTGNIAQTTLPNTSVFLKAKIRFEISQVCSHEYNWAVPALLRWCRHLVLI